MKFADRGEAFREGVRLLEQAGIVNPAIDASVLLGHVTGEEGSRVLLDRRKALTLPEEVHYVTLIERRCRRESVSQLVGQKEFYSRTFYTNRDVLDPRPETEILVEKALCYLQGVSGRPKVLDIGTGSGAIAVTLAAENRHVLVTATEISAAALRVAAVNSARHGTSDRIRFVRTDLAAGLLCVSGFDLIVSNPPYVAEGEYRALEPEVHNSDPAIALIAGKEGTEFYPPLAEIAGKLLRPGGCIIVEAGAGQGSCIKSFFQGAGLRDVEEFPDLSGVSRVVMGIKTDG